METTLSLADLKLKLINIEFTINELNSQFLSVKELIDNITSNNTTSEEKLFFLDIMGRLKFHKEFNTWYDANGDWVIEQNAKTGFIYINRFRFWSLFEENFNLDYQKTKALLTNLISKHFDLTDFTSSIHIRCNEIPKIKTIIYKYM